MSGDLMDGGFLPTGSSGSQPQIQKKQSFRRITIRQFLQASENTPEDETQIDGHTTDRLCFVGVVRSVDTATTRSTFRIEDGTGTIDGTKWNQTRGDLEESDEDAQFVGKYVAAYGSIRIFNNKRSFNVLKLQLITDFNEVIRHQLEALATHLYLTRGNPGVNSGAANGATTSFKEDSLFVDDGSDFKESVLNHIPDSEPGIHGAELARKLGVTQMKLKDIIHNMETEGLIYEGDAQYWIRN